MAQRQLPGRGDPNWGKNLNDWLKQLGPESKGGFNFGASDPDTASWDNDEEGYIFINTTDNEIKRWNGFGWDIIMTGTGTGPLTGSIMQHGSNTPPEGWLLCRGQAVSRTIYSGLFSAISTTYGSGDGSTTFNLPDFQGKCSPGVSTTNTSYDLGDNGGLKNINLSHTHSIASHNHTIYSDGDHRHYISGWTASGVFSPGDQGLGWERTAEGSGQVFAHVPHNHEWGVWSDYSNIGTHNHGNANSNTGTTASGGVSSLETLQPFLAVNYIIKT